MRLPMLSTKTMLLIREVIIHSLRPARPRPMRLHMVDIVVEQLLLVHLRELFHGQLQISNQSVGSGPREVFPHNDAHHLQFVAVRRHGVCWYHPAALAQLVSDRELVEVVLVLGVEAESDEWEAGAAGFGHENEAHGLYSCGEVVGCAGNVGHDAAVAGFACASCQFVSSIVHLVLYL